MTGPLKNTNELALSRCFTHDCVLLNKHKHAFSIINILLFLTHVVTSSLVVALQPPGQQLVPSAWLQQLSGVAEKLKSFHLIWFKKKQQHTFVKPSYILKNLDLLKRGRGTKGKSLEIFWILQMSAFALLKLFFNILED